MMFSSPTKRALSLPIRLTGLVVTLVTLSILVMALLGYTRVAQLTSENASIRIDRAAKAASSTMVHASGGDFTVERDDTGRPLTLNVQVADAASFLQFTPFFDGLLAEIGANNQGAANLFAFNTVTNAFDRFATTFRRPDGSMPPPMSISAGHPAFTALRSGQSFQGEVPVMGRMRLANLTPILDATGGLAGALAVDVGWTDDLVRAQKDLRETLFGFAAILLLLVAGFGIYWMTREMKPLRSLAAFANDMAAKRDDSKVPYIERKDEVGALAQGLSRVVTLQDELEYLAYTDPLTNQGNRARFMEDLREAIGLANPGSSSSTGSALIQFDVKRFTRINDAYGSAFGDRVLRYAGKCLVDVFGPQAKISRQGDDKFWIILPLSSGMVLEANGDVVGLCHDLLQRLAVPMRCAGSSVQIEAAIGMCLLPQHASSVDDAVSCANLALHAARLSDDEPVHVFSQVLQDGAQREMSLEVDLRSAIDTDGLAVHFQPQIDPNTGQLFGLEALARWVHPTLGFISPQEFIGVAERNGLIVDLGDWVLDASCAQARLWLDEGLAFGHVAVNISPVQLWQKDFIVKVEACLAKHGLEGKHLCLEVTESVFADRDDLSVGGILHRLRDLGICLSLDDFGSGYSSLGYLNSLPFDQLKIDRAFVSDAPRDPQRAKLLQGIAALGHGLGMTLIAEGAEMGDEVDYVRELGVSAVQGYFYARPVPASELAQALATIDGLGVQSAIDDLELDGDLRLSA